MQGIRKKLGSVHCSKRHVEKRMKQRKQQQQQQQQTGNNVPIQELAY